MVGLRSVQIHARDTISITTPKLEHPLLLYSLQYHARSMLFNDRKIAFVIVEFSG